MCARPLPRQEFLGRVRKEYEPHKVLDGVFGAMMDVALVNDGPVTITLDSQDRGASSS